MRIYPLVLVILVSVFGACAVLMYFTNFSTYQTILIATRRHTAIIITHTIIRAQQSKYIQAHASLST
jgi:hypothetical protein